LAPEQQAVAAASALFPVLQNAKCLVPRFANFIHLTRTNTDMHSLNHNLETQF